MSTPDEQRTAEAIARETEAWAAWKESTDSLNRVVLINTHDAFLAGAAYARSASPVGQDALAALNLGRDHLRYLLANNSGWAAFEGTPDVIHEMGQALASASRAGGAVEEAIGRLDSEARRAQLYANVSVYDLRLVIDALRAAPKPQASEGGAHE